jgi:hypothetical protein
MTVDLKPEDEPVEVSLAEDALDLAAFEERRNEKSLDFEDFMKGLQSRGEM